MIDVLKIHSKSLRYTIGKLTETWKTRISYDSSVGSRNTAWNGSNYGVISGPYFPVFGQNTEIYLRKYGPEITPYLDTFHAVKRTQTLTKIYDETIFISCCWFYICLKRIYFATLSNDCFWNMKMIFLTTIIYMTTRDAFTATKIRSRIGLKRYLMNRSSFPD